LGSHLWKAYQENDFASLRLLSDRPSPCFNHLKEVCQAHIDRFPAQGTLGRPEKCVQEIMSDNTREFNQLFAEFSAREGIYGLGDLQVKRIFEERLESES
jgi:hypothetical protein